MNIQSAIAGKRILITGGTGTVGQEVIRRLLPLSPKVVRIFSRDETKHFYLQEQLRQYENVRFLIGDVRDKARLRMALEDIDIVFHLAAMKHVGSCEYNPFEAIKTNILGTQNLVETTLDAGVEKVIMTSSDKAVNPSNAMGTSKLMAEKLMVSANHYKGRNKTTFSGIRFGNVLGSSGSVLPTFIKRIREGLPIELTHPEMTRFVTSFSHAVELLFTAMTSSEGGDIFIRKMPVIRIIDLAEVLATEMSGLYSNKKVSIEIIGVRPGEKLGEELFTEEESTHTVELGDYFIVKPQISDCLPMITKARPVQVGSYCSSDQELLSQKELREMLYQEKVFAEYHGAGDKGSNNFELSRDFVEFTDEFAGGIH